MTGEGQQKGQQDESASDSHRVPPLGALGSLANLPASTFELPLGVRAALKALKDAPPLPSFAASHFAQEALRSLPRPKYRTGLDAIAESIAANGAASAAKQAAATAALVNAVATSQALEQIRQSTLAATAAALPKPDARRLLGEVATAFPIAAPARPAPVEAGRKLAARAASWVDEKLMHLGDHLAQRHDGARDAVERAGPDSMSQAAHSLVELMIGLLRDTAEEADIKTWLDHTGITGMLDNGGHPTYEARARYLLERGGIDPRLAEPWGRAIGQLISHLQNVKHGSVEATAAFMLSSLLQIQSFLFAAYGGDFADHEAGQPQPH